MPDAVKERPIESVFMGGGTPSLFSPGAIAELLAGINDRLRLPAAVEVTLEANPATVDLKKFSGFRAAGVNRLSIGVQSFDDDALKALGRAHTAAEALSAIEATYAAGFPTFNVDLMCALPGQTSSQAVNDVERVLECEIPHVSHYQLTLEPNTYFHRFPPVLPDADTAAAMQSACGAVLQHAGYERYEVSAWAQPGHRCRHNLNYWRFGDYLGIGAGAHGKLTSREGVVSRMTRYRHPRQYLEQSDTIASSHTVDPDSLVFEFALNGFRLTEGFSLTLFQSRTGLSAQAIQRKLQEAEEDGLVSLGDDHVGTTALGARFIDDLVAKFLPEDL